MIDLLEAGQQWLADQLQEHASRSVVYHRNAESVAVQATIGRTLLKLDDGYGGVRMQWTDRDFLIRASDLVLNGTTTSPERGDRITETVGVNTSVFEVMAYGPAVRGGSGPSRVESYAVRRGIRVYNVTGSTTWEWMQWAAKTGRFAAIGAAANHFQTLYAWDAPRNIWYVCDNNSPQRVDEYTWEEFRRLHLSSGQWVVVLDYPPSPAVPRYVQWW